MKRMFSFLLVLMFFCLFLSGNICAQDSKRETTAFKFGFDCGRAYQFGRTEAVEGRKMLTRDQRNMFFLFKKYSDFPDLLKEEIHKEYERGYVEGIRAINMNNFMSDDLSGAIKF